MKVTDENGNILIRILDQDCALRFNGWAHVLASKSAGGRSISDLALDLRDTGKNLEALSHIIYGAACNWCQLNSLEPWFNIAHIASFILEDGPRTWAITEVFFDQMQADSKGSADLFLNPN